MRFQLSPRGGMDLLLDLPWQLSLTRWDEHSTADRPAGADDDRRVVVVDGEAVELRELPPADAERAHHVLRALRQEGVSVVDVVGVVSDRRTDDGDELPAVLLTALPEHGLPYEVLLDASVPDERDPVVDAAVSLLVELHLAGFVWHDPSLTRMRFRSDAGRLGACLVDVGAGELHEALAAADRLRDVEIATSTIADELLAAGVAPPGADVDAAGAIHALRHDVRSRYRRLWHELTHVEQMDVGDSVRGEARLRRVNELGFDVEEIRVTGEDGPRVSLGPAVLEPGHHRRRLRRLTGLAVQENQARRLLADIDHFRATATATAARAVADSDVLSAKRWLLEVFVPTVAAVPAELRRPDQDDAELFHELLEHRYYLSERAGHDVGTQAAVDAYVCDVLTPTSGRRSAG